MQNQTANQMVMQNLAKLIGKTLQNSLWKAKLKRSHKQLKPQTLLLPFDILFISSFFIYEVDVFKKILCNAAVDYL